MEQHYNAFISYRHHPEDIRVAEDIHRSLERFVVPRALRKQGKGIQRLFRDKDELPITSSLTENITNALKNSDYLIVICSVHTKESVWVQREIETFLQTHDRSRVLTVLCNGEPFDVIPEILLYEDTVDPLTGQELRKEIEPLSCDWRVPRKKAVREELPRLAAALLGCGYDELRQRQRQYRLRRMIALFSATLAISLGLMAYFIYTGIQIRRANEELQAANDRITAANEQVRQANVKIQQNLDNALWNQSEYLASSAGQLMQEGDRLTAIALALEALPEATGERPYVPAAEKALSTALSSYVATEDIQAEGAFYADAMVHQFQVTADGGIIYMLDATNNITAWDTRSFERLSKLSMGEASIQKLITTPAGNIIVVTYDWENNILCYDPSATLLWQTTGLDIAQYTDGTILLACVGSVRFLDPETGEATRREITLTGLDNGKTLYYFCQTEYEPEDLLTFSVGDADHYYLYLLDTERAVFRELMRYESNSNVSSGSVRCVSSTRDGNILVMFNDGSGARNGRYGEYATYGEVWESVTCYSPKGKILWQSELTAYTYNSLHVMEQIPDTDNILCMMGDCFTVLDGATGRVISTFVMPDSPMVTEIDGNMVNGILSNGTYYYYEVDTNTCNTMETLDRDIVEAQINHGIFVRDELSYQVTVYRSMKDDRGELIEGDYNLFARSSYIYDDLLLVNSYGNLYMFDMAENTYLWNYSGSSNDYVLGMDGQERLWIWRGFENILFALDARTGATEDMSALQTIAEDPGYIENKPYLSGNWLYYARDTMEELSLYRCDLTTGEKSCWSLETLLQDPREDVVILQATGEYVWLWSEDGSVYEVSTANGAVAILETGIKAQPVTLLEEENQRLCIGAGNQITITSFGGGVRQVIDLVNLKAVSMYRYGAELLVLCDDGTIYRYDGAGNKQTQVVLDLYSSFFTNVAIASGNFPGVSWHETADGDVIVNIFNAGNIIDATAWGSRSFVPNTVACYAEGNRIFCMSDGKLVAYPVYTTEQQVQRGKDTLKGFTLTQEQKLYYGLD